MTLTYPITRDTKVKRPAKPKKAVPKKIKCETKNLGSKKCSCSKK